jgi:hypothetical protein
MLISLAQCPPSIGDSSTWKNGSKPSARAATRTKAVTRGLALSLLALACTNSQRGGANTEAAAEAARADRAPTASPWQDLLPPATLEGYRRVPLDPLADKAVWQVRDGALFIDGIGAKEMLLTEREFGDGVLHVEWRFLPATGGASDAAPVYNGGVYVRTALDGKSWVQLQVAHVDAPPVVGDLIAQVVGRAERVDVFQTTPSPAAPIGEWNTYDISARGPEVELSVNGRTTVTWRECPVLTGHLGLQAEGSAIEVRAFRFQPL